MLLIAVVSYLKRFVETHYRSFGLFPLSFVVSKLVVIHVTFNQGVQVEIGSNVVDISLEKEEIIEEILLSI